MSTAWHRFPTTARALSSNRPQSHLWIFVLVLAGLLFAAIPNARAAFVTTNEAGVNGVFSQPSFGSTPIDIRFNPTVIVDNADLLNINTSARLNTLFGLNFGTPSNVISLYFVDTIDFCDGFNTAIVGCATVGGNDIVVESAFAAGVFGTLLIAHEIGHNFSLGHLGFANLMTGSISGSTTLNSSQVSTILASSKIQLDGGSRFAAVTPVMVTPLPPAGILFVSAILGLLGIARRRKWATWWRVFRTGLVPGT